METNEIENRLWPEDIDLFTKMDGHYVSENEKIFFETLHYKMEHEFVPMYELLLDENENDDMIFMYRIDYDEFILGHCSNTTAQSLHVMNLSEVLSISIKQWLPHLDMTLLEWLRIHDYKEIRYNRDLNTKYGKWQTIQPRGRILRIPLQECFRESHN